jgi:hypothetical protein
VCRDALWHRPKQDLPLHSLAVLNKTGLSCTKDGKALARHVEIRTPNSA